MSQWLPRAGRTPQSDLDSRRVQMLNKKFLCTKHYRFYFPEICTRQFRSTSCGVLLYRNVSGFLRSLLWTRKGISRPILARFHTLSISGRHRTRILGRQLLWTGSGSGKSAAARIWGWIRGLSRGLWIAPGPRLWLWCLRRKWPLFRPCGNRGPASSRNFFGASPPKARLFVWCSKVPGFFLK